MTAIHFGLKTIPNGQAAAGEKTGETHPRAVLPPAGEDNVQIRPAKPANGKQRPQFTESVGPDGEPVFTLKVNTQEEFQEVLGLILDIQKENRPWNKFKRWLGIGKNTPAKAVSKGNLQAKA